MIEWLARSDWFHSRVAGCVDVTKGGGCIQRGSGLPMPRRRTFATALQACAHSDAAYAFAILAALGCIRRLWGMGSPSQDNLVLPAWRAGFQERTNVRQGKRGQDGELSVKQLRISSDRQRTSP